MNNYLEFEDINAAQLHFMNEILHSGSQIETRGSNTLEIAPVFFCVTNPRARITTLKDRNWKLSTALGELTWHLSGSKDVKFISNYLSNWSNYSQDNTHISGSCYGSKIFEKNINEQTKWESILSLLKEDPNSRRAVISLLDPSEVINKDLLDISCTLSLQFLIRNSKLDIVVNMRSNDAIWGLPYDFFVFSYFQELMAVELKIPIGKYFHFTSSLHIYDRHINLATKIVQNNKQIAAFIMPEIPNNKITEFVNLEKDIRNGNIGFAELDNSNIDNYWKELLKILYYHKNLKEDNKRLEISELKTNSFYSSLL